MLKNRQKDYLFNQLITGMDKATQATLWMMYNNSNHIDDFNHRQEMEQMKKEIADDVLSRLSATVDVSEIIDAIAELRKLIDDLGGR